MHKTMSRALEELLKTVPVQVMYAYDVPESPWKAVRSIACSGDEQRRRVETQVFNEGNIILHSAMIFHLDTQTRYLIDLREKSYQVVTSWWDTAPESGEPTILEVKHEEPDPHVFLITSDLQEVKNTDPR